MTKMLNISAIMLCGICAGKHFAMGNINAAIAFLGLSVINAFVLAFHCKGDN